MKNIFRKLILWFRNQPKHKQRERDASPSDIETTGRWYFKRDILDRMDGYMRDARHIMRAAPAMYALYQKTGAVILSQGTLFVASPSAQDMASARFGETSFGAVVISKSDEADGESIPITTVCFLKKDTPPANIQRINRPGSVYEVFACWVDGDAKFAMPVSFHVHVGEDGGSTLLRERRIRVQPLPNGGALMHHLWGVSDGLNSVLTYANERNEKLGRTPISIDDLAERFLFWAYDVYRNASMDVRIAASKGGTTAVFSVDLLRVPYFFSDRDPVIGPDGKKKRIFHIVRTHKRVTGDKETYVRSHFRGLRKFKWNGYSINVTMPGFHHPDILDTPSLGAHHLSKDDPRLGGYRDVNVVGEALGRVLQEA